MSACENIENASLKQAGRKPLASRSGGGADEGSPAEVGRRAARQATLVAVT